MDPDCIGNNLEDIHYANIQFGNYNVIQGGDRTFKIEYVYSSLDGAEELSDTVVEKIKEEQGDKQ